MKRNIIAKLKNNKDLFALVISLVALMLSQFPPLYQMNLKAKIQIDVKNDLLFWDMQGKNGIDVSLVIKNIGNKKEIISNIKGLLVKKDSFDIVKEILVKRYLLIDSSSNFGLNEKWDVVKEIPLAPYDVWMYTCQFELDTSDELQYGLMELAEEIQNEMETDLEIEKQKWIDSGLNEDNDYEKIITKEIEFRDKYTLSDKHYKIFADIIKETYKWMKDDQYYLCFYTTTNEGEKFKVSSICLYEMNITKEFIKSYFKLFVKYRKFYQLSNDKKGLRIPLNVIDEKESRNIVKQLEEKKYFL